MQQKDLEKWHAVFLAHAREIYAGSDPSHDILHIRRVVATALSLAHEEGADIAVVLPAAFLHDCVNVPKNDPRRGQASRLSAARAVEYLASVKYPAQYSEAVFHAIAAHSFSAGIAAETIEARVVQDADRLDALGAVGIARCFSTGAVMGAAYYDENDMLAKDRGLDDRAYSVDHFFAKLLKLPDTMQTEAGREEGRRRADFMRAFLDQLSLEVSGTSSGGIYDKWIARKIPSGA